MINHKSPISGIAAFQKRYVATAGYDNQVILWDVRSQTALARVNHDHLANHCRFSACGRYLVTASSDHTARLWSVPELKLLAIYSGHDDDVEMAAIDPTGTLVATASRDNRARIFDLSGRLRAELRGHRADVISVEWSSDGRELLSSSDDGTIRRWNALTGTFLSEIDLMGVETDTIVCAPDGTVYAGNDEGEIVVIRGADKTSIKAHRSGVKRIALDSTRGLLVSLSYDRSMKVFQCGPGGLSLEKEAALPSVVWPRSCAFLGQTKIVFGTFGSSYATYDFSSGTWELDRVEETPGINAVLDINGDQITVGDAGLVRRNGNIVARLGSLCNFLLRFEDRVITGGQSGEVFDALSGRVLHRHKSPLNCGAAFTRNGRPHFILGAYTGEGLVFSSGADGTPCLETVVRLHPNAVKGVASGGSSLFSVCATGAAAFHSAEDFSLLRREERAHKKISNACENLADGRFSSVSRDLKLRIWSAGGARTIPTPHTRSIKCVRAQKDGKLLACGSYNGWVHVYDVEARRWVRSSRPTTAGISSLSAACDGRSFLASSYDGSVYRI